MSDGDGNAIDPAQAAVWKALERRDAILQAVSYAAERFLGSEPLEAVLTDVLERLGKAAETSGATVLEFVDDAEQGARLVPRYSWTAAGVESVFEYAGEGFAYAGSDFEHLYMRLESGRPVVAHSEDIPPGLRSQLPGEIRALAVLPIFAERQLVGAIAVSQRGRQRDWAESELGALKTAATVIGAALERNRTRRAVRKRDELLRLIVDNAPLMVAYFDRDMRCRFANRRYADFFGYQSRNVVGKTLEEIIGPDAFRHAQAYWQHAYAGEQAVFERPHAGPDGSIQHLEVRAVPHHTESGEVLGCYAILTDITERRRSEAALRQAHDHLEEKVRERTAELAVLNRELEAYSYSVSHDLRAPLRAIDGFSHLLAERLADRLDAESSEYLGRVRTAVQRMSGLIDDLLELGRVSRKEIERQEVNLSQCAREIIEDLAARHDARRVECAIEEGIRALGDPQLLRTALQNLLENAWKYTSKTAAARIEFSATRTPAGRLTYRVSDNGAGFDMSYAEKLFQPFQRLHNPREFEGSGIGLATVARIVRRHGGDIGADGEVDRGATFWFSLPAG
ncbi:MAG: PAS domain-containing protein [Denitratisoma sp.]|nr:PAS domain-containing protein [Denitratisoma sp.]